MPAPITTTDRPARLPEHLFRERSTPSDERVGRGPERRLLTDPSPGPRCRVEQAGETGAGHRFAFGEAKRLAHLRLDLRLAEHHGVQATGDGEQMLDGVSLPMGVQALREVRFGDALRLDQQPLQRQEPCVIARDRSIHLDAIAGREHHGFIDPAQISRVAIPLDQVVLGERERLEEIDRGVSEGDAEGEDGHDRGILPSRSSTSTGKKRTQRSA